MLLPVDSELPAPGDDAPGDGEPSTSAEVKLEIPEEIDCALYRHRDQIHQIINLSTQRDEENKFTVKLTIDQKRELANLAIKNKSENGNYSKITIKTWMRNNYPEEYHKHEKYNDWHGSHL